MTFDRQVRGLSPIAPAIHARAIKRGVVANRCCCIPHQLVNKKTVVRPGKISRPALHSGFQDI